MVEKGWPPGPERREARPVDARWPPQTTLPGGNKSVLIVDDDPFVAESRAKILSDNGYAVTIAWNGQEGLELLRFGFRPDVIVLDLVMPIMNGWRFRSAQVADPILTTIPVIIVSTAARSSSAIQADFPGAAFVRSDVGAEELLSVVLEKTGSATSGAQRGPNDPDCPR